MKFHPITNDVVVKVIAPSDDIGSHAFDKVLQLLSDSLHLRPHMMSLEKGKSHVLPHQAGDCLLFVMVLRAKECSEVKLVLQLRVDGLREVKTKNSKAHLVTPPNKN
jgi:hypothetical protein